MNIRHIKLLDAAIGRIAASLFLIPAQCEPPAVISSFLIIRPGGIGDAVLLAPAIILIKKNYPQARIIILAEQRNAGVFPLIYAVDEVICYDRPRELLMALHSRYDVVIDTEQWHRMSAVVARFSSASVKIGFDTNERRRMFTHTVPYSHEDYEAVSFKRLLEPLELKTEQLEPLRTFLSIPETASSKVASLLGSLNGKPFVVIFPGASIAERRWGAERFKSVAKRLADLDYRVVIVGGSDDRDDGDKIAGDTGLNVAGITTLVETAAVIDSATLVVSGDSGVLHLAVGLNVPTVSLFGSGIAAKWAPEGERHIVINHNLPCSPCTKFGTTPSCPINARCIMDITPDEVMAGIGRLIQ